MCVYRIVVENGEVTLTYMRTYIKTLQMRQTCQASTLILIFLSEVPEIMFICSLRSYIDLINLERLCNVYEYSLQFVFSVLFTVHSFTEITKLLLAMDGVNFFLSDKLNQDPVEEFFSKQRSAGGHHDNPSAEQFGHHLMKNIAAGSHAAASRRANVRREQPSKDISDEPLPKKKR